MPASKSQQKAVNKYMKENYDRINLIIPKGEKEKVKDYASLHGESVNAFIWESIREKMERDIADSSSVSPEIMAVAAAAAAKTGETTEEFLFRAADLTAASDERARKLNTDPVAAWAEARDLRQRQAAAFDVLTQAAKKQAP